MWRSNWAGTIGWHPGLWDIGSRIGSIFDLLLTWQERANQRHQLSGLDDRLLADVGLNRVDVAREVRKPFWMQ